MNIGIDIGNYKTVVASSASNGIIVFDELSYRSFKTIVEMTIPRKYGSHVGEPMNMTFDKRCMLFLDSFDAAHYGFLKYVVRLANGPTSITVTVPFNADMEYREKLADFFECMGLRVHVMTDVVAAGFLFGIKHERAQNIKRYAVLDLGHSKTTLAIFSRNENLINTELVLSKNIGAIDIDKKIVEFLATKYKIDNIVLAEKIRLKLEKTKASLNGIHQCKISIDNRGDQVNYDLTQEEYLMCISEVIKELDAYFKEIKEHIHDLDQPVQLVGGNRFNVFVGNLLKEWNLNIEMNAGESVAIGAALTGAVCRFGSKNGLELYDVVPSDIFINVITSDKGQSKPMIGIKQFTKIPSPAYKVTIKKQANIDVEFVTNDRVIKSLCISDITDAVELKFEVNSLGKLNVEASNCKFSVSKFDFKSVVDQEKKMAEEEMNLIKIGEMRNELENAFSQIPSNIFNDEQTDLIASANKDILFASMSKTIEEEVTFRNNIYEKIDFVEKYMQEKLSEAKATIENKINLAETLINNNSKVFVPSIYKLRGLIYNAKQSMKNVSCDIFGLITFYGTDVESYYANFDNLLTTASEEISKKLIEKEIEEKRKQKEEEDAAKKKEGDDEKKNKKDDEVEKENDDNLENKNETEAEEVTEKKADINVEETNNKTEDL